MPNDQTTMTPYHKTDLGELYCGDSLLVLPQLRDNSVDTILTDPPYALKFMGQEWDKVLPAKEIWVECLRVAKPGAMMLVFGGDRTHHRLMVDIEDAGWEIRTCVYWLFGSGFPKSLDIAKAIDKINYKPRKVEAFQEYLLKAVKQTYGSHYKLAEEMGIAESLIRHWVGKCGSQDEYPTKGKYAILKQKLNLDNSYDYLIEWAEAQREIIGKSKFGASSIYGSTIYNNRKEDKEIDITIPATPEAQLWDGWGSGLKPAVEIIVLAMKPLDGTFAENALKWGVGGLNIDGGRIGVEVRHNPSASHNDIYGQFEGQERNGRQAQGRYPSNLLLSHSPECRQTGVKKVKSSNGGYERKAQSDFVATEDSRNNTGYGTETVPAYECVEGCAVKILDEQSGDCKTGGQKYKESGKYSMFGIGVVGNQSDYMNSSGGASRFFYTAKASRSEREQGLKGHIPCVKCGGLDTDFHLDDKGDKVKCVRNNHSTVKPLSIIEYLARLTETPTKGIVLDPFLGSGTTAVACEKLGRKWIGIELSQAYCKIAKARLAKPQQMAMAL